MRLIHTSDWHLGRRLKGEDRTPEIDAALNELLKQAKELQVDAVLVAGDIYDVPNPPAEAEQVAYNFFCKLKEAKIPAVVIAGNHDSAFRIDGIAKILSYIGVEALGRPQKANKGYQFDAVQEFRRYYLQHQKIEVPTPVLEAFKQLHQEMSDAIA